MLNIRSKIWLTFQLFLYGGVFRVQHRGKQWKYTIRIAFLFFSKTNVHNESIIIIVITSNTTNDFLFTISTFRKILLQYQTLELGNKN